HMSKNIERNALQRILGSTAFAALARATFMVSQDPDDGDRRLFLPVKFNLGKAPAGLAFRPEGAEVQGISTVRAAWEPSSGDAHPDEVLRRLQRGSQDQKQIEADIRAALVEGPVRAKDLAKEFRKSERTLRWWREKLRIEYRRDPADPRDGAYYWLPPNWTPEQ